MTRVYSELHRKAATGA